MPSRRTATAWWRVEHAEHAVHALAEPRSPPLADGASEQTLTRPGRPGRRGSLPIPSAPVLLLVLAVSSSPLIGWPRLPVPASANQRPACCPPATAAGSTVFACAIVGSTCGLRCCAGPDGSSQESMGTMGSGHVSSAGPLFGGKRIAVPWGRDSSASSSCHSLPRYSTSAARQLKPPCPRRHLQGHHRGGAPARRQRGASPPRRARLHRGTISSRWAEILPSPRDRVACD